MERFRDSQFTYGLAAEYPLSETFSLIASATTLYKGVEMVDVLASNRMYVNDNTDLKAETGINKEVGFKYHNKNTLGANNIGFSFKVFDTRIDDSIVDYMANEYQCRDQQWWHTRYSGL